MKKLGIFNKIIFFFNSVFATALLLAYILPYIPPKTFPFLAILCLGVPLLLICNAVFLVYWVIKLKKQFLLSAIILLLGFNHILSLYKFTDPKQETDAHSIKLMSYNVRQFNRYNWIAGDSVPEKLNHFVKKEAPSVFCVQEYYKNDRLTFSQYPYQYIKLIGTRNKFGQAIFSKLPIINKGSLDFPHTGNNAIYADILMGKDTVRVFNIHLESLKISDKVNHLGDEDSKKLIERVGGSFKMQQYQTELILEAIHKTPYKTILCGDLNNSAFSYVYRRLSKGYQDAFKEAGTGFGKTFDLDFIPLRIDVFLADKAFEIETFKNYSIQLSDHYPISTTLRLKK